MHSVIEFRKHLFWSLNWLQGNKEFKQKLATIKRYDELIEAINIYFSPFLEWNHLES
jgi:tRNA-dihydrouridine synthase